MKPNRDNSDLMGKVPPEHEEKRIAGSGNGYVPIPAEGKAPRLVGWQNVDADQFHRQGVEHIQIRTPTNTGIRLQRYCRD